MRTALVLLFLVAAAASLGSVFPQRPISPARVDQYLRENPGVGPVLDRLGMFDVFGAPWFTAIYLTLLVALVACLVPRIRALLRVVRSQPPRGTRTPGRDPVTLTTTALPETVTTAAGTVLRARRFRVAAHAPGELAAEKGYLREAGSILFHISLLLLLIAFALGRGTGFRGQILLGEGEQVANTRVNYRIFEPGRLHDGSDLPPFTLRLDDFSNSFRPDGTPADFSSQITVTAADGTVQQQRVAVNHPLTVDGVQVFQADYGYAPVLRATGPDGRVLHDGPVRTLRDPATELSNGALELPSLRPQVGLQLAFFTSLQTLPGPNGSAVLANRPQLENPVLVVWPYEGDLRASLPGDVFSLDVTRLDPVGDQPLVLRPGERTELPGGGTLEFEDVSQYTVLTLASDPGMPVAAVASILLLAALVPSLYVQRRRVWVRTRRMDGVTEVTLSGVAVAPVGDVTEELAVLARQLRGALPGTGDPDGAVSTPATQARQATAQSHPDDVASTSTGPKPGSALSLEDLRRVSGSFTRTESASPADGSSKNSLGSPVPVAPGTVAPDGDARDAPGTTGGP